MMRISSLVQKLNEHQCGVGMSPPLHPYTCAHRDKPGHQSAGGDLGLLIATDGSWLCPYCSYTQTFSNFESRIAESAAVGFPGMDLNEIRDAQLDQLGQAIQDFETYYLSRHESTEHSEDEIRCTRRAHHAVPFMLACLYHRQLELEGVKVRQDGSIDVEQVWQPITALSDEDRGILDVVMKGHVIINPLHPGYGPKVWIREMELQTDELTYLLQLTDHGEPIYWRSRSYRFSKERKAASR